MAGVLETVLATVLVTTVVAAEVVGGEDVVWIDVELL